MTSGSSICSRGVLGGSADGDCCVVIEECRRVEFEAEDVVESSANSMTLHVCNVASGAKDTLRLAIDLRLMARLSSMACFSDCLLISASRLIKVSCCSSSVLVSVSTPGELSLTIGLNGSGMVSAPVTGTLPFLRAGPGVEKSISMSSPVIAFAGYSDLPVLRLRNSSKVGMTFGGVKGTVGFSMDLI